MYLLLLHVGCVSYYADIMLVVDESVESLTDFLLNITSQYPVSPTETNIRLVQFSAARRMVRISINEITNESDLLDAINVDKTNTRLNFHKDAMTIALDDLRYNGRSNARDIIMFITDGWPSPPSQSARSIAAEARSNGTAIYGIFIGSDQLGKEEITNISSSGRAFLASNVDELNGIINGFVREICNCKLIALINGYIHLITSCNISLNSHYVFLYSFHIEVCYQ